MIVFENQPCGAGSRIELSIGTWCVTVRRTAPKTSDLIRMYDAAWLWHPMVELLGYSRSYTRLFDSLANDGWLKRFQEGAKVFDGGIGTGTFSLALAKSLTDAVEIHGIDIAPRMLARARDNFRRQGRSNLTVQLRYGNVDTLPYAEGHFDLVMGAHLLEYSANPFETLQEMVRVLRVGAPLLVVATRAGRISALHGLRWRYRAFEPEQLRQWLHQAGLVDIRRYTLDSGLALPSPLSDAYIGRKINRGDSR